MGAKRQYTAVFAIGAKLLGSFRGAMMQAQARLRGLQNSARRVTGVIGKLGTAFSGLFAIFGTFLAANILSKIFSTATEEAVQAEERTRSLLDSLGQMSQIRAKGAGEAQKQLDLIYKHNEGLQAQGVLHKDVLDTMAQELAIAGLRPGQIQDTIDVMQNLLIKTKGVRGATEEAAKEMADKWAIAIKRGTVKGMGLGIVMGDQQAKAFKKMSIPARQRELERLAKGVGNLNQEARGTPLGRIQLFNNAIQDLAQEIGDQLVPAQAELADAWRAALPELKPLFVGGIKWLMKQLVRLGLWVRDVLIPGWHEFQKTERFQRLKGILQWIQDHFKQIAIGVGILVGLFAGLSVIATIAGLIMGLANPISLIIIGVTALAAAIMAIYYNWDAIKAMFPATAAVIEHFIEGFKLSFQTGFDTVIAIWKTLVALFTGDFTGVGEAWAKVWQDMVALAQWWQTTLIAIAKAVGQAFKDYFLRVFEDIKTIWEWLKGFSWEDVKAAGAPSGDAYRARHHMPVAYQHGGIVSRPTLAMIGERGPEAVIPLGRGAGGGAGGGLGTTVNFAPNIVINGNASEAEQSALDSRLRSLAREFVNNFKRAQTHERRLSYEGGYG